MKYCIFIPTYKRANNVETYKTLRDGGYNGDIYLVVGTDDPEIEEYKRLYGKQVILFNKEDVNVDVCDNFGKKNCVVFARNAIFDIAKEKGVDVFCVLDDDYNRFSFRRVYTDGIEEILKGFKVEDLNSCILASFDYLYNTPILDCFAWCQDGDFIGGAGGFDNISFKRKIMNAFFFKTKRRIRFMGSINEDLSASVYEGQRGKLFFTISDVSVHQQKTQQNRGGLTDIYLDTGTYVKSFYSVIVAPNCVKVHTMGSKDLRIHHRVDWNLACPKLIREEVKIGSEKNKKG